MRANLEEYLLYFIKVSLYRFGLTYVFEKASVVMLSNCTTQNK